MLFHVSRSDGSMATPRSQRLSDFYESRSKSKSSSFSVHPPPPPPLPPTVLTGMEQPTARSHGTATPLVMPRSVSPVALVRPLPPAGSSADALGSPCVDRCVLQKRALTESVLRDSGTFGPSMSRSGSPLTDESWCMQRPVLREVRLSSPLPRTPTNARPYFTSICAGPRAAQSVRSSAESVTRSLVLLPPTGCGSSVSHLRESGWPTHTAERISPGPLSRGHFVPAGSESVAGAPIVTLSLPELAASAEPVPTPSSCSFETSTTEALSSTHLRVPEAVGSQGCRPLDVLYESAVLQLRAARREQAKQAQLLAELHALVTTPSGHHGFATCTTATPTAAYSSVFFNKLRLMWLVLFHFPIKIAYRLVATLVARLAMAARSMAWSR